MTDLEASSGAAGYTQEPCSVGDEQCVILGFVAFSLVVTFVVKIFVQIVCGLGVASMDLSIN